LGNIGIKLIFKQEFLETFMNGIIMEKRLQNYHDSYGLFLITQFVARIFPEVRRELARWTYFAGKIPDKELRQQALASLSTKKFHAQGGSVYALYPGVAHQESMVSFIVAFQTISDYLDNLCDRAGVEDEFSFRQLHLALSDAADPNEELHDYYQYYPYQNDLGYLGLLVSECRTQLVKLPALSLIIPSLKKQVKLYTDLQALKHIDKAVREDKLKQWALTYQKQYPEISWWEFSAATGSTLGIFLLAAAASQESLDSEEIAQIDTAYFPWIDGLHILLDYFIDAQEDRAMGDLNFTNYYQSKLQCQERLSLFIEKSFKRASGLLYPKFHKTVIMGLLAMYLSDPKAITATNRAISESLLHTGGSPAWFYYRCCRLLRTLKKL
jgi:tetraprenyl-beta-curcumene synthase